MALGTASKIAADLDRLVRFRARETVQEAGEQRRHAVVDAVAEHAPEQAIKRFDAPKQAFAPSQS